MMVSKGQHQREDSVAPNTVPVDPSNIQQFGAWDGGEGAYWAANADDYDHAVAEYHRPFMAAASIGRADRVLDIGCGTGQTTREAARAATDGAAVGVDLSSAMLLEARQRAAREGLTNVTFEQLDAQIHPFEVGAFDVAISRSGSMFFGDLVAAFTNIRRALRPGGRVVLLTWQPLSENEWIREFSGALAAGRSLPAPLPDAPGPFSLSDPDRVRAILAGAGFSDIELTGIAAGTWFGTDADAASRFVLGQLGWMLEGLDDPGRSRAIDALRATTAAHETDAGVVYASAAWIIGATHR
jgi:SAM-dependent methyltransferase